MDTLAPCPSCTRHVRVEETRCPFCDAATDALRPLGFDPSLAPARVRNAVLALGASMALGACVNPVANVYGGPPIPPPAHDAQAQASPPPSNAPVYGGPPPVFVDAPAMVPSQPQPTPTPQPRTQPRTVRDPGAPVPAYGVAPPRDPERH